MSGQLIAMLVLKQPSKLTGEAVAAEIRRQFSDQVGIVSSIGESAPCGALMLKIGADLVTIMQIDQRARCRKVVTSSAVTSDPLKSLYGERRTGRLSTRCRAWHGGNNVG